MQRTTRGILSALLVCSAIVVIPAATLRTQAGEPTVDAPGLIRATALRFPSSPSMTPVDVRFAPDGRIYAAFKEGVVLMYDGVGDTTPVTTLDISSQVNTFVDRGLLGIALDPAFASGRPYLYVLYTYDRDPFGTNTSVPRWGHDCPYPPGGGTDGCPVTARLERYTINAGGTASAGGRLLLLDGADNPLGGWCHQYESHSIGTVEFGTDGMLYVGAGDGANYGGVDFGQLGGTLPDTTNPVTPVNPCNDDQGTTTRSGGRGTALAPSTSRGGALRSQAVRNALPGEYVSWDGAILRLDPDTGQAAAGNPLLDNGIAGDDRIVAYGLRNPFRFTFRPGTDDLWLGDVGYNTYEEIDTTTLGTSPPSVPNFGWPCIEGSRRQPSYDALDNNLCETLYASTTSHIGGVSSPLVAPKYSWSRYGSGDPVPSLPCHTDSGGGASVGGAFAANDDWPVELRGAYVFGDYARGCLMAMPLDSFGIPDASRVTPLVSGAAPVDILTGPNGDIYWVDIVAKELDVLSPAAPGPIASFAATPAIGPTPLHVAFDASTSSDSDPMQTLTYAWDLDGDGSCDDASGITATATYSTALNVAVTLCVKDGLGNTSTTTQTIRPGDRPPVIQSLVTSAGSGGWKVGDTIAYSATAGDPDEVLPASAYAWSAVIRHCDAVGSTTCHSHLLQTLPNGPAGSVTGPDHEFYAFIQLTLTVTDARGATASTSIDVLPRLSTVMVQTVPPGITVSAGGRTGASPYSQQFLEGGDAQLIAPRTATIGGATYTFVGWDDSATATNVRDDVASPGQTTFTARYVAGRIRAVAPLRLLDTRSGLGAPPGPLEAGTTMRLQVGGVAGIPTGAGAAVLNVTAVDARADGYVTAFPCGSVPLVSNLNVTAGDTVANLVTVPLDAGGGVCFVSQQATDLVVDLSGVVTGTGDGYTGITPVRAVDTREAGGPLVGPLSAGPSTVIPLDAAAVPADASAVAVNLTVTEPASDGYLTAFPCGTTPPLASNLNFSTGQTVSNLALVSLGSEHALCMTSNAVTHVVVDVSGWLQPGAGSIVPIAPTRGLDTRLTGARLVGGQTVTIDAASLGAPVGASALIANVTAVDTVAAGFLTVYPCGASRPLASNVNHGAHENRPVLVLAQLPPDRRVCVYASTPVDVVVDVQGWIVSSG